MTAKRKITDKNGVQVFPITHTKAVFDDNGNSVEERLQENLDLINQKQLEVGAVPSDATPTAGSTNWVTSAGVYAATVFKEGHAVRDVSINGITTERKGTYYNVLAAVFKPAYNVIEAPKNPTRLFFAIPVEGLLKVVLSTVGNLQFSVSVANVDYSQQTTLPISVPANTIVSSDTTWKTNLEIDIEDTYQSLLVNVRYSDDSNIATSALIGMTVALTDKEFGLYSSNYLDDVIGGIENTLYAHEDPTELQPTYLQGQYRAVDGTYMESANRVSFEKISIAANETVDCVLASGYKYNIIYFNSSGDFVKAESSSWLTTTQFEIKWSGKFAINIANLNDTTEINAATFDGLTMIKSVDDGLVAMVNELNNEVDELIVKQRQHPYTGERIDIKGKSFTYNNILTLTSPDSYNGVQSLAVFGDKKILGRAREESGKTSFLMYSGTTFVSKLLLPHTGYDALHANTICFGEASSYELPLLYVSQWNAQRACLVYEIDSSYNTTLVRVIDPAGLSASLFGAGAADWIVGDGYLYSIAYIVDSPYPAEGNGLRVCKFGLPTGIGEINLTDSDVIESYDIDPCFVRQDSCYVNGKIYTMFGGGSTYQEYRRMQVMDVFKKQVVSVCDMQFAQSEPEAIDVYDGNLCFMFNSVSNGIYKFIFD